VVDKEIMKKIIGVISLVIGVLLLVWGHKIAQSPNSQIHELFTGAPTDRATYYYIAGVALGIFGLFEILWPGKTK
jgi:drug/metabolite transporter (DMT)-like permease